MGSSRFANRYMVPVLLVLFLLLIGSGCTQVTPSEEIMNAETIKALTPSPTPTPSPTLTPTLTPTPSPTPTLTPTPAPPTPTPTLTPTPIPPTPTTNPALRGFNFCDQAIGDMEGGRFSARTTGVITAESSPAFDRVIVDVTMPEDSAALSAQARLLSQRDYTRITGEPSAPGNYVLLVDFPNWLHDSRFDAATITPTHTFTTTRVVDEVTFRSNIQDAAGASLLLALEEPTMYQLRTSREQTQLRIQVARPSAFEIDDDPLSMPAGGGDVEAPAPLYFLLDNDIWAIQGSDVISLTQSPEVETALAVSRDGQHIAFCRTQEPGMNPTEGSAIVPGALWMMQSDGSNPQPLAGASVNCAAPAFSPDGSMIAFSVDETGVAPPRSSIKIVSVANTTNLTATTIITSTAPTTDDESLVAPLPIIAEGEGWNRSGPQWIDNTRLVYAASAPDTRNTLFLLDIAQGIERDIGADIQVVDELYRYQQLGPPLVAPDGSMIAVEAWRADKPGADLLLLDSDGVEQDVIDGGYWNRPLAWGEDGSLFYLATPCASSLVHPYTLYQRDASGGDTALAEGMSMGTTGDSVAIDDTLIYVFIKHAEPGPRGPARVARHSAAQIWVWPIGEDKRGVLFSAQRGITGLAR